ncbi:unnamed protein product [Prorocentrum cordatum]|uniref:Uncharacterized protein n=1 Tax=Prorocentrum cordatum TaxID=2364126 RepID=A0ABN9W3Y4_9DINO|nr:unnamed protein product [Polarella glacialis]
MSTQKLAKKLYLWYPMQDFFNTGLLGAIITTTVGSIIWQLVASVFPVAFMHNPLVYVLLRICLFLEFTGVCSGAWVLASCHKYMARLRRDEFILIVLAATAR